MLGGKSDPPFSIDIDGELRVNSPSPRQTAVKEVVEELGALRIGATWTLTRTQMEMLEGLDTEWRCTLRDLNGIVDAQETGSQVEQTELTWSSEAARRLEVLIDERISPCMPPVYVPDTRTTQNAGYSTTVSDVHVRSEGDEELGILLLALQGDDNEVTFHFEDRYHVQMQSTHKDIFARYLQLYGANSDE